jgi:hypothetical protein
MDELDDLQVRFYPSLFIDSVLDSKTRSATLLISSTKALTAPLIPPPIGADMNRYEKKDVSMRPVEAKMQVRTKMFRVRFQYILVSRNSVSQSPRGRSRD